MLTRPQYIKRICLSGLLLAMAAGGLAAFALPGDQALKGVAERPGAPSGTQVVKADTVVEQPVKKLLVVGDSMTGWLGERLNAYGELNGFEVATIVWDGSTIGKWAKGDALERYVGETDPDAVIISLGLNELFEANPEGRLKASADKLLEAVGNRQLLWLGPPSWPGKGQGEEFNAWMEKELGPGRYFNSSRLELSRQGKTNPHPSRKGMEQWVEALAGWIPGNAEMNLRLDSVPASGAASRGKTFVYKKMTQSI